MRLLPLIALLFPTLAQAEVPRVVTDFGPVQSLVADVMGDLGAPAMLLPPGADPHDFQLRPSQARTLADAQLVFWVGPELMPDMEETFATLAPQAQVVPLLMQGGGTIHQHADGAPDPHAWLDPDHAIAWLDHIALRLSDQDPANAETYRANAEAAASSVRDTEAKLAAALGPLRDRPFVTYHDALGYFADHFGLALKGAIELGDATSPSAAQLAHVGETLAVADPVCIFAEEGRDPRFIDALAADHPVRRGAAQDVEFITLAPGRGQYPALLAALGATLQDCLAPG